MIVDGNASADVGGQGEIETRRYTRGSGNDKKTYYDADVYRVERHVDFTVDDLPLESSSERGNLDTRTNTNNIINTILPFDTKNAVKWNASYLAGFTSEKRDQNVEQLRPHLEDQLLSIARSQVEASVSRYDRGVRWEAERRGVHGTRMVLLMNEEDIGRLQLAKGQMVTLVSAMDDGVERRMEGLRVVPYPIPRGNCAGYYPELNRLVPLSHRAKTAHVPAAKSVPVRIVV